MSSKKAVFVRQLRDFGKALIRRAHPYQRLNNHIPEQRFNMHVICDNPTVRPKEKEHKVSKSHTLPPRARGGKQTQQSVKPHIQVTVCKV